jgi:hypothetical protein
MLKSDQRFLKDRDILLCTKPEIIIIVLKHDRRNVNK